MALSASAKRNIKRIKDKLNTTYEPAAVTPTAGPVGSGKLYIGGQVFDGNISGVTQVVNVGRPAAAQYAPKVGGSSVVVSSGGGGGGSSTVTLSATPGTLSAATTNQAAGSHTHAIDASAAPGAAEYLLKSSSIGLLTLPLLAATTSVTTPSILSTGNLSIAPTGGNTTVTGTGTVTSTFTVGANTVNATAVAEMRSNAGYGSTLKVYRNNSNRWNVDFSSADLLSFVDATTSTSRFAMTLAGNAMIGTTTDNGYKLDVAGTMRATTSLTTPLLTTATNVDLIINPAGTGAVQFPNDQTLRTTSFDSSFPITGWQINEVSGISGYSSLTIGKIQADELAVRVFVADEVRVDRGDEYWTKSYGIVATTFATPSTIGGTVSVKFEDSPALAGAIFTNNDWVLIRKLDIDTGITLSNVWGQVATYVNNSDGTQNWTFTLRSGPTSESITKGSLAIDFGASGAALIHLSVIDSAGAPYIKMRKWAGANPYTPSNFTTYIQLGQLGSTGNSYYTPSGYGLYIRSTAAEDQFMVADDNGLQIRGPSISLYNSTTQTILMNNTSGINVREDVWGSWDNRRALQWWPDVASMSGDPSLSVYTGKVVGGLTANQNFSYIDANPTGNVLAGLSITAFGQGTATDATLYLEGGSQSLTTTPSITMTATNIDMIGAVDVTGSLSVGGTAVSLSGHTHSYLPLAGGTLSGAVITDIIRPATHNTKTVGSASIYYSAGYFDSLYVNTIVGTPSYSHTHSAGDITSGTLDENRLPHTWSGALTLDADASAGSSNYLRLATQTGSKFWDLIGRAYDYGTAAQQNDLLLTFYDGSSTYIVLQADSGTRVIDFLNTPTVGGTAVSLSGHTHDDRYYTETEVNSLLTGYVPTSRTVSAGSGLTGGGALSANITLTLDTPGSLSATSTNTASGNHTHAVSASEAPGTSTAILKAVGGLLTLPQFTATTKVTTPLIEATNRLGVSTGASGVTESTAYNGVYVHAASNAAIQLLTPNTSVGLITFGDSDDNDVGRILYRHSLDVLDFEAGATLRLRLGGSTYAADVTGTLRATGAIYADAGVTTSSGDLALTSTGGTVAVTGALSVSGAILAAAGNAGAPGVAQSADLDTGMYWPAANTLGFSAGGTQRLQLSSTGGSVTGILSATLGMVTPSVTTASGNLALSGAGGSVTITGALVGSSWDITNTGTATMATSVVAPTYTSASGNTTVTAPATLVLNAATANSVELQVNSVSQWSANDTRLNPRSTIVMDLGDYNRKLRTLYAAEMYVETLVAQDVMSTIGGRILVAPTTTLIADLSNSATTNLYSNLQAYWSLDEASGNKADSKSGNTLTNTNTVATVVGKVGNASRFTKASSQYLTIADNVTLSVGDIDFYFSFWVYPTLDDDTDQYIAAKAGGSGNRAWDLRIDWVNARLRFTVYNSSDVATTVNSANSSIAINTWYFVECWHDSVNNQIAVAINNGTAVTAAHTTGVKNDTGPFQIGARNAGSFFQGYVDGFGFWKYLPNSTDRAFLYNSGNGRTYANMVAWSSIDVKHNSLSSGTYVYLQTAPDGTSQIEAMQVISSATAITGGYRYQTLRNLDASGNNTWVAGDAVVSLGSAVGQGYIDLSSTATIHSHIGPTITVFSRTDTTAWNSVKPVVTMGNLRSFVDYSGDEYGQAAGNDLTLNPASGFAGYTIDRTNGLRLFNTDLRLYSGATQIISLNTTSGLSVELDTVDGDSNRALSYKSGATTYSWIKGYNTGGWQYIKMAAEPITGLNNSIVLRTAAAAAKESSIMLNTTNAAGSTVTNHLWLHHTTAGLGEMELSSTSINLFASSVSINNGDLDMQSNDIISVGTLGVGTSLPSGLQINSTVIETARGVDNVRIGVNGGAPRIMFEDAGSTQWCIDNNAGTLRFFTPGVERMSISSNGQMSVSPAVGSIGHVVNTPGSQTQPGVYLTPANCGSSYGPWISIDRNNNGSTPSAGWLRLVRRDGNAGDLWVDVSGNLRIGVNSAVTNATDAGGTVVGSQTSSLDSKNIIEPFIDYGRALNAIVEAPLYDFTYKSGAFGGQRFTGIVTDYAPTFGMDKDEAHPAGKSLNEITAHGYTFAAIKALHARIGELENQVRILTC